MRDTVRAYQALMASGTCGQTYNVCSGHAHRIGDVLDRLLALSRVTVRVEVDPRRLRPIDNGLLLGDPTRIRDAVGWQPRIALAANLASPSRLLARRRSGRLATSIGERHWREEPLTSRMHLAQDG